MNYDTSCSVCMVRLARTVNSQL